MPRVLDRHRRRAASDHRPKRLHVRGREPQAALADFIEEGHFRAHVRRMAARYGRGVRALATAIEHRCGPLVRLDPARTGLQLAVWSANPKTGDRQVADAMGRQGYAAAPLSAFYLGRPSPGLLLGLSGAEGRADGLAELLADLLQDGSPLNG